MVISDVPWSVAAQVCGTVLLCVGTKCHTTKRCSRNISSRSRSGGERHCTRSQSFGFVFRQTSIWGQTRRQGWTKHACLIYNKPDNNAANPKLASWNSHLVHVRAQLPTSCEISWLTSHSMSVASSLHPWELALAAPGSSCVHVKSARNCELEEAAWTGTSSGGVSNFGAALRGS